MTTPGWHDAIRKRLQEHERERDEVVLAETFAPGDEALDGSAAGDAGGASADGGGDGGAADPAAKATPTPDWKLRLRQRLGAHERERVKVPASAPGDRPLPALSQRFRMIRELGRGGMGAVLEAEDEQLGRRVALKVLLEQALASPSALERFAFEARAAARLRHPGIVAVHEVGEHRGQRYLVMDLVPGRSLAELLQEQGPLEPREAAGIAKAVAEALAHAHAHAILHRDVKPGNVLITPEGQPLLTDFGLAKDVESQAEVTASGQAMGTPAYMPPEQAQGLREQIDRRADVYALGATLYHMLTGRPPFVGGSAVSLLRQVVDDEPPPPSKLRARPLDRDLETIVLTCLEKDPARRYDSASALADDLGRYLAHEPIAARRATWLERLGKWRRRNRAVAATLLGSGLLLLAVVVGGTALALQRVRRERDVARAAATEAREALDLFVFEVREQLEDLPSQRAREARARLLALALQRQLRLQQLEAQAGLPTQSIREPEAQVQVGDLALEAGQVELAHQAYQRALEASRELAAADPQPDHVRSQAVALVRLSRTWRDLGHPEQAPALVREALTILAAQPPGPDVLQALAYARVELGDLQMLQNDFEAALAEFDRALELARGLVVAYPALPDALRLLGVALDRRGETLRLRGDPLQAVPVLAEGVEVSRRLAAAEPGKRSRRDLYVALTRIGDVRLSADDHAGAGEAFTEALALARDAHQADPANVQVRRDLAFCLQQVGVCASQTGAYDPARAHYVEALAELRELRRLEPAHVETQRRLARLLDHMADHAAQGGEQREAEAYYRESLAITQHLTDTESGLSRRDLAVSFMNVGDLERQQGLLDRAEASYERARALLTGLVAETPSVLARDDLATLCSRLGRVRLGLGQRDEGQALLARAVEQHRALLAEKPDDPGVRAHVAVTLTERGLVARAEGRHADALADAEEALALLAPLGTELTRNGRRVGRAAELGSSCLRALGREDEARALAAQAVASWRAVSAATGGSSDLRELGVALGEVALLEPDPARRLAAQEEVVAIHRRLLARDPTNPALASDLATSISRVADACLAAGDPTASQRHLEQAVLALRQAVEVHPDSPLLAEDLGLFLQRLGHAQQAQGQTEAAEATYREAIAQARPLGLERRRARDTLARALLALGSLRFAAQDLEGSRAAWEEGLAVSRVRLDRDPESLGARRDLSIALLKVYNVRMVEGRLDDAAGLLDEAVANHRALVEQAPRYAPELAQFEELRARHPRGQE